MLWNRLFLGIVGLYVAFSAGGKLQLWLDERKVWRKLKSGGSTLLSYEETPLEYVTQIGGCMLVVLSGLFLVWVALGGSFKKRS